MADRAPTWPGVRLAVSAGQLRATSLQLLAAAACLGVIGGAWDAAWHVTLRRESFWSPPHLLLYSGTALSLAAAAGGLWSARARGRSGWSEPGFAIAATGALIVIGAAPLDEFWHRTFGPDVDVWSFPHLVALAGGCAINFGAIVATTTRGGDEEVGRGQRALAILFLAALLWVAMFGLNWYTLVLARVRDAVQYPLLATLAATPVLALARSAVGRGGATAAATVYTAYVGLAHWFLAQVGYALLPFPPLVLAPALGIDLASGGQVLASRGAGLRLGLVGGPLFYLAEWASLTWYPHPALPPPRSEIALGYFTAALERPWDLAHMAIGLPLVVGAALVGGLLGVWLGRAAQRLAAGCAR